MALCRGKLYKLMMCGTAKEKAIITRNSWNKQKPSERRENISQLKISKASDVPASSDRRVLFKLKF